MILLTTILAYLLGGIPTGVLATRALRRPDVRHFGSGHMGGSNVARSAGTAAGIAVALVDALKGAAALGLAAWLLPGSIVGMALAGGAVVAGHCWSPFIGGRGGMGLATAGGILIVVAPLVVPAVALLWALARLALRQTLLALLLVLPLAPFVALLLGAGTLPLALTSAVVAVLEVRHAQVWAGWRG